jgi:ABC-type nitrate/sulfonate/bicarbonate transport system substrate-binding protein
MLAALILPFVFVLTLLPQPLQGQTPTKLRAAYTSIAIQMDPIYIMKELNLPRKYGLDIEILYIPVSSRAIQAALAGKIQLLTSAGVANINANLAGGDLSASPPP